MDIILLCGGLWGRWSFFWLLDVMQQLSWEVLQDEAVKEVRNHKRGNTRMSGAPRLSAQIKSKAGLGFKYTGRRPDTGLASDVIFNTTRCFSVQEEQRGKKTASHAYWGISHIQLGRPVVVPLWTNSEHTQWTTSLPLSQQFPPVVAWNRILVLIPLNGWFLVFLNTRQTIWPNEHLNWGLVSQVR